MNGRGTGSRKRQLSRAVLVADFETTTDPKDCRIWAWGVASLTDPEHVLMGTDMATFINRLSIEDSICYFHNLGFDGKFILDYIMKHGYVHVETDQNTPLERNTFKTLISSMGKFYSMNVCWSNGVKTEFRDSVKKLPMSVRRIAKAFKLEESKGELDYDAYRPVGHVITEEEAEYIRKDVVIVAKAMQEVHNNGMTKLTVASDAMAEYKRIMGTKSFQTLFPVFSSTMDAEIRRAYRGGFTYADPRFSGRQVGSGLVLDVNSLYPSVMRYQPLPYGEPDFVDGIVHPTEQNPLTIFSVTFTAKIKPNHIPCIQIKGASVFSPTEYLSEIKDPVTLMVTGVDWALYNDHYDIKVQEYGGGWRFKCAEGFFDTYIDKWSEIKAASTGGKREIAKLHLNSLYGKFASNPNVTGKYPVLEDGAVRLRLGADATRNPVYTATGVFITSYARDLTIRAAQDNYSVFAYADTDSLHLMQDELPSSLEIHPSKLGAWKHEYNFDSAFYIRAKAYLERHPDGTYTNRIAGLPEDISAKLTFDDVKDQALIEGKLTPVTVPGGVVLMPTPYRLKL